VPCQTLLVRVVDGVVCSLLVRSAFSDPAGEGGRRGCLLSPGEKCLTCEGGRREVDKERYTRLLPAA